MIWDLQDSDISVDSEVPYYQNTKMRYPGTDRESGQLLNVWLSSLEQGKQMVRQTAFVTCPFEHLKDAVLAYQGEAPGFTMLDNQISNGFENFPHSFEMRL